MPKTSPQIYQIKVTLDGTHPPVWRRILVPGNTTLLKLHDILQIVMGWQDSHLHMFTIEETIYGNPEDDEFGDLGTKNETRYKLSQVIHREGQRISYEYDFGDSWDHTLLVEKILPPQEGVRYPLCLKGKRACPPEDVGGVWGYEGFLEAIRDPDNDEHDEYLTWVGEEFDSEAFDLEDVNAQLSNMGRGRSAKGSSAWSITGEELSSENFELASPWPQTLPAELQQVAEELPLRRDIVTFLTYLRDNKVTGTQSTGNLPLKAVHEICARFVDPPQLEATVGERVFHVRSETEIWPLFFCHTLAAVGGLVDGGMGKRWFVTPLGERYLAAPSPLQVWLLLATWWTQINWAIASPFGYLDDNLPASFFQLTLTHLLEVQMGVPAPFEQFADHLIEDAGLIWPIADQGIAHEILQSIVEHVVINPLVDFGILQTEYSPHKALGKEYRELSTLLVTHFGKGLLEAIHVAME